MEAVYIILLNWNGWKDTCQCLESVLRSDYPNFRVIVCDNRSTDGSMQKIKDWAEGKVTADEKISEKLKPLIKSRCRPICKNGFVAICRQRKGQI